MTRPASEPNKVAIITGASQDIGAGLVAVLEAQHSFGLQLAAVLSDGTNPPQPS
jgi:short-subunit dehydrogenase